MSDFDHEHVSHLLNIVAQCAGHSGKLGAISNEAMAELLDLNAKMHVKGMERRKAAQAEEASKKQAAVEETEEKAEEAPLRPSVFPRDSQTATIADANIDRRL